MRKKVGIVEENLKVFFRNSFLQKSQRGKRNQVMERENSWVLRKIATSKSLNVHNNLEERNVKEKDFRKYQIEKEKR